MRRGEKSFHFRREFTHVYLRLNSRINEELLESGERGLLWGLPFYSDESEPYLFYDRQYDTDLRLWKVRGFHVLNLSYRETMQNRLVADEPRLRRHREESVTLKEVAGDTYLEQKLGLFQSDRDRYYGSAGEIDGYKLSLSARRRISILEITTAGSYRRAESATGLKTWIADPVLTTFDDLGAEEVCNNHIDDNCVAGVDEVCDWDGDGYTPNQGDCDDANDLINPSR